MENLRLLDKHRVIITSHDDSNPVDKLHILSKMLEDINFNGDVIFDLLTCNGLSGNRFIKLEFNGKSFSLSSIVILKNIDEAVLKEQDNFFLSHPDILEMSVLSKKELIAFQLKKLGASGLYQ